MNKQFRHTMLLVLSLLLFAAAQGQIAMPDTVCAGTSHQYRVNDASRPSTYTWKVDGAIQASTTNVLSMTWNVPGIYLLSVQEHSPGGCDGEPRTGTVVVKSQPVADAGADLKACFGTALQLQGSGGDIYQWSPATYLSNATVANPFVRAPGAGVYTFVLSVQSRGGGCVSQKKDTVVVTILPEAKIFAGRDTAVLRNNTLQLQAVDVNGTGFNSYLWSPPDGLSNVTINNPLATVSADVRYVITATTTEGCTATDDIVIKVFSRADIFVPTAFTPNGDGKNDEVKAVPVGIKEFRYFRIYNRWGQLVFSTSDYTKGWDGVFAGKLQDTFTFVWIVEGVDFEDRVISKKGTVTLIR